MNITMRREKKESLSEKATKVHRDDAVKRSRILCSREDPTLVGSYPFPTLLFLCNNTRTHLHLHARSASVAVEES